MRNRTKLRFRREVAPSARRTTCAHLLSSKTAWNSVGNMHAGPCRCHSSHGERAWRGHLCFVHAQHTFTSLSASRPPSGTCMCMHAQVSPTDNGSYSTQLLRTYVVGDTTCWEHVGRKVLPPATRHTPPAATSSQTRASVPRRRVEASSLAHRAWRTGRADRPHFGAGIARRG